MTPAERKDLWEAIDRYVRAQTSESGFAVTDCVENIETAALQAQFRQMMENGRFLDLEGWEVVAQADCVACAGERWSGTWSGRGAYNPRVGDREIVLRRKS